MELQDLTEIYGSMRSDGRQASCEKREKHKVTPLHVNGPLGCAVANSGCPEKKTFAKVRGRLPGCRRMEKHAAVC